jgi:hypothetical protein
MTDQQRRARATARAVVATGLVIMGAGFVRSATAAAAAREAPIVRDYSTYPQAVIPVSCRATPATSVLQGVRFESGGQTKPSLRDLALTVGSKVTMRWDGFTAGCEGVGVGLSDKANNLPTFDHTANQYGVSQAYCGPGADPCVAPFSLELTIDPAGGFSCFQLDAHLGPQLAVVGPAGAYYELNNSVYPTLISAFNGGTLPCVFTPCHLNPQLPAASIECRIAAGTAASTSSTTAAIDPTVPSSQPAVTTAPTTAVPAAAPTTVMVLADGVTRSTGPPASPDPTATTARVRPALPATGPGPLAAPLALGVICLLSGKVIGRATTARSRLRRR